MAFNLFKIKVCQPLTVSERHTLPMNRTNKSVLSVTDIIVYQPEFSDTLIDVVSICLSSGLVSDYCSYGPVGMLECML